MSRKFGGCAPFWGGGWVPIEHKVPWAEAYLYTKWHRDASSHLGTVENWGGGSAPFLGRGAASLSNTKSPGLRPTSVPSGILIHPSVWPRHHRQLETRQDRQDRTDNGPIGYGEPFYKRSP